MRGLRDDRPRLGPEGVRADARVERGLMAECDVDVGEPVGGAAARERQVAQRELGGRLLGAECGEQLGDAQRRGRADEPDLEHALRGARQRAGGERDLLLHRDGRARLRQERLASLCERDAAGVALEQLDAEV